MSLTQSKTLDLPVEVVDMIANWVYRPRDLLSLALSHSRFYQIIVPDHLHYRHVEFFVSDYAMWKCLLRDSRRLSKIESIKFFADRQPSVPPIKPASTHGSDTLKDAAKINSNLISNAFKGMRVLHTVIWDSEDVDVGILARLPDLQRAIWKAIDQHCPTVRKVDTGGFSNCWICLCGNGGGEAEVEKLNQITTFNYQTRCSNHLWSGHSYFSFLYSFQRLQHLTLFGRSPFPNAQNLSYVLSMKFPLLESFVVKNHLNVTTDPILRFLAAHPLLQTFKCGTHWSWNEPPTSPLNTGSVTACKVAPRLAILESPIALVQALFQTSDNESESLRPMRSLYTILPLSIQNSSDHLALLSEIGPQLEDLTVGEVFQPVQWHCGDLGAPLRIISSAFPNLRRLDFGSVVIVKQRASTRDARPKVHDWISAFSELPRLVALTIPWDRAEDNVILVRSSTSRRRQKTMEHFLNHCPRLRFLFSYCCTGWVPHEEISILIGHNDADIRFRGARLIDKGAVEDRKWALYDGRAKDLTDEVLAAVRARA